MSLDKAGNRKCESRDALEEDFDGVALTPVRNARQRGQWY